MLQVHWGTHRLWQHRQYWTFVHAFILHFYTSVTFHCEICTHDRDIVFFSPLVTEVHSKSERESVIILTLRTSSEVDVELDLSLQFLMLFFRRYRCWGTKCPQQYHHVSCSQLFGFFPLGLRRRQPRNRQINRQALHGESLYVTAAIEITSHGHPMLLCPLLYSFQLALIFICGDYRNAPCDGACTITTFSIHLPINLAISGLSSAQP